MDWFYTVLAVVLSGVSYFMGRYQTKAKTLRCDDIEALKRVFGSGRLTPLLKSENGDLYEPTRCIVILDSGKPLRHGTVESRSRIKAPCIENYIDAVVDKAVDYGVSKEEVTKYMAKALTYHYDMHTILMNDKEGKENAENR